MTSVWRKPLISGFPFNPKHRSAAAARMSKQGVGVYNVRRISSLRDPRPAAWRTKYRSAEACCYEATLEGITITGKHLIFREEHNPSWTFAPCTFPRANPPGAVHAGPTTRLMHRTKTPTSLCNIATSGESWSAPNMRLNVQCIASHSARHRQPCSSVPGTVSLVRLLSHPQARRRGAAQAKTHPTGVAATMRF